jgi:hypothetical protein
MINPRDFSQCLLASMVMFAAVSAAGAGDALSPERAVLDSELDLGRARSAEARYYFMETRLTHYEVDGSRTPGTTFRLYIEARPGEAPGSRETTWVCRKFTLVHPGKREVELPTLGGWTYTFNHETGIDEQGQVFGIPHKKFAMMVDSRGDILDTNTGYMVYNAFIDFHGLTDVFATRTEGLGGIQSLRRIGDSVVHAAANTSAPVNLGEAIKKGSEFRNGEVTLELKGLSIVDSVPCALLEYDSGESSYVMYLSPMPGMDTKAEGGSHYFGDLYLELDSGWLRKATLHELVVSQVTSGKGEPIRSVIERTLILETKSKRDFERL